MTDTHNYSSCSDSRKNFSFTICTLLIGLQNCHLYHKFKNTTKKCWFVATKFTLEKLLMAPDRCRGIQSSIKNKYILTNFGCIYSADLDDGMHGARGQSLYFQNDPWHSFGLNQITLCWDCNACFGSYCWQGSVPCKNLPCKMCPRVYGLLGASSLKIQPVLFPSLGQVTVQNTPAIHMPVIVSCVTNGCFGPGLDEPQALAQTKVISMIQHHHFNIIATFRSTEFCHKALNMKINNLHEDIRSIQFL